MKYILFLVLALSLFSSKKEQKKKSCEKFENYFESSELTKKPSIRINFNLSDFYPEKAKSKNIRVGESKLKVYINKKGELVCLSILKKNQDFGFDEAAIAIIKKAKFKAGEIDKKAVNSFVVLPIKFTLDE
jgi:periplasmic protein TonB